MNALRLDVDETEFKRQLIAILARGGVRLHHAIATAINAGVSAELNQFVAAGTCVRYGFKNGGQSHAWSLKGAIEHSGFDLWYWDIQIDMRLGIILSERDIARPSVIQWLPFDYGSGVQKNFKFKHHTMKTRERHDIQILHPRVPANVLKKVLAHFNEECPCNSQHLVSVPNGVWEWQQPFGCVLCGKQYLCECFRTAVIKSEESMKHYCDADSDPEEFIESKPPFSYREGICHLCSGKPSDLFYCHPMYGSAVKVRYGAYIEKFSIAENLSARDAENKVRDMLDVPRIGEGWISETQLYKLVRLFFSDYEVVREARPEWLGNQRLDIFVPALSVAIEYQGEQHFQPVKRFGGEDAFREGQLRDKRKRQLCKKNKVALVYFRHGEELSVEGVEKKLKRFLPASN